MVQKSIVLRGVKMTDNKRKKSKNKVKQKDVKVKVSKKIKGCKLKKKVKTKQNKKPLLLQEMLELLMWIQHKLNL